MKKSNREYTLDKRNIADKIYKILLILSIIVICALFVWLYQISRNNLISLQYSEVQSLNKDVSYILENRRQKIAEDAMVIERYFSEERTNTEILTYLHMENSVMSTLDSEYSDIYGYFHGSYLDGSGWVPGLDFTPTERPWYLAGLENGGEIAFASPYVDAISGNLIISYAKLLSDGESVISYDVQLSNMQKLVADTVNDKCLETLIFDQNEIILADSQTDNISLHFNELTNGYYPMLYAKYNENPDSDFEFSYEGYDYYVFNNPIVDGMKQLVLVDASIMFAPLKKALIGGTLLFIVIILMVIAIMYDIDSRRKIAEDDLAKIKKLYYEANTDKLTGLYNRRAYEDKLAKMADEGMPNNLVLVSYDLNGLKAANDTQGHVAGDKLICGAADAIKNAWGKYGKVYRIGGDEFSAIVEINGAEIDSVRSAFTKEMEKWSQENDTELSVSYGLSSKEKLTNATIRELVEIADANMYKEKSEYYKKSGKDRRKR